VPSFPLQISVISSFIEWFLTHGLWHYINDDDKDDDDNTYDNDYDRDNDAYNGRHVIWCQTSTITTPSINQLTIIHLWIDIQLIHQSIIFIQY